MEDKLHDPKVYGQIGGMPAASNPKIPSYPEINNNLTNLQATLLELEKRANSLLGRLLNSSPPPINTPPDQRVTPIRPIAVDINEGINEATGAAHRLMKQLIEFEALLFGS